MWWIWPIAGAIAGFLLGPVGDSICDGTGRPYLRPNTPDWLIIAEGPMAALLVGGVVGGYAYTRDPGVPSLLLVLIVVVLALLVLHVLLRQRDLNRGCD